MPNIFGSMSHGRPKPHFTTSLTPIPVTSTSLQAPATKNQLFVLGRNSATDYFFTSVNATPKFKPRIHGRFLFAILASEPETVYCGQPYDMLNRLMEGNQHKVERHTSQFSERPYNNERRGSAPSLGTNGHISHPFHAFLSDNRVEIEGHTSITKRKAVLFAGDMTFNNGVLTAWTNNSGHYRPPSHLRSINLSSNISRLLPEHLYQECIFRDSRAINLSGSIISRHLSDFSS